MDTTKVLDLVSVHQVRQFKAVKTIQPEPSSLRIRDPFWNIGHLCLHFARALASSFGDTSLETRYPPENFATIAGRAPWPAGGWTPPDAILQWVVDIRDAAVEALQQHDMATPLPAPQEVPGIRVETLGAALFYVVHHNSFHFGAARALLATEYFSPAPEG